MPKDTLACLYRDRAMKIQKLRNSGLTLKAIGIEVALSMERVRQILLSNDRKGIT